MHAAMVGDQPFGELDPVIAAKRTDGVCANVENAITEIVAGIAAGEHVGLVGADDIYDARQSERGATIRIDASPGAEIDHELVVVHAWIGHPGRGIERDGIAALAAVKV